ncbi:hypothetical protein J1N35_026637 [Gossypium stocksii]|uniref:RNase H type-1 domain-containing protein n=1 Tax=Gossypium stocksii TaxID=47602 RepID=A0A9D3V890_9ROSI|nr:hypothetical protein J1N35_026637 [Gossypium stocksii]
MGRIEDDLWVPNAEGLHIKQMLRRQNITRVVDPIDSNNKSWKSELFESTFSEEDAQKILQIPLAHTPHDNFLAWRGESTSEYTVGSGYKLLLHGNFLNDNRYNPIENRKCYKKLWNSDLPSKIVIRVWRATLNYLPTLVNLKIKRLTNEVVCSRCTQGLENREHIFRDCAVTKETWDNLNYRLPEQGFCKINFDAAINVKKHRLCSDIIVRDSNRDVLATKNTVHKNIPSEFAAEAIACLQAILMGRDLGLKYVKIEGDSLTVIKKVQSTSRDKLVIGSYIQDIKELIKVFHESQFQHARGITNEHAYRLALKGLKMEDNAHLVHRTAGPYITEAKVDRDGVEGYQKDFRNLRIESIDFSLLIFPRSC